VALHAEDGVATDGLKSIIITGLREAPASFGEETKARGIKTGSAARVPALPLRRRTNPPGKAWEALLDWVPGTPARP
jgi:hypothetical protein